MAIRHAGQVTLPEDRRRKTWLCKNHNTRCRLQQVGTGARPNDEEERVLNSAMQPNNGSQPAEDIKGYGRQPVEIFSRNFMMFAVIVTLLTA